MGVLTGALAIVRKNGTAVARLRNISFTENTALGSVKGLGTLYELEAPALGHIGSWSAEFYETEFATSGIPEAIRRDVQTKKQFEDQLLFSDGFQIDIFKNVEDAVDPNTGLKRSTAVPYAILKKCFIESDGSNIPEGTVASRSQSGRYLEPVIYPK